MAVTMKDTQEATYPAPSEADSKGFPVTGDTITTLAHGATQATFSAPGKGGRGSANSVHHNGGDGGSANGSQFGGGGGSSAGTSLAGANGSDG